MAKDPVCGMQVERQEATSKGLTSEYEGQTYYFCAPGCKQQFDQNPQRYVSQETAER
jgi:YHS domain-containing protein